MIIDALIKNGIVEHSVELLLEESGYLVSRISREGLLSGVSRDLVRNLNQSNSAGKIMTAPSFAVFDKSGKEVILVKVKFRNLKSSGKNISHGLKQLTEYWPEALLIVVTTEEPYFRILDREGREGSLEDVFPKVKKSSISQAGEIVKKFLGGVK